MELNLKAFVTSYLLTASWVECDSDENKSFTDEAKDIAEKDCVKFIQAVRKEFGEVKAKELLSIEANDLDYLAPHDFYLTRNGHGAGFWDKSEKYGGQEIADKLTKIAEKLGNCTAYHVNGKSSRLTF